MECAPDDDLGQRWRGKRFVTRWSCTHEESLLVLIDLLGPTFALPGPNTHPVRALGQSTFRTDAELFYHKKKGGFPIITYGDHDMLSCSIVLVLTLSAGDLEMGPLVRMHRQSKCTRKLRYH